MPHEHAAHLHAHGHLTDSPRVSNATMGAAVVATLGFVVVEALAGWFGHSLALISDAGHNLADAMALAFSWYALRVAGRPAHHGMTFGYHRVGVIAALVNAVSLVVIALFVGWEAVVRIRA